MSRLTAEALMAPGGLLDAGSRLTQTIMTVPLQRAAEETRREERQQGLQLDVLQNEHKMASQNVRSMISALEDSRAATQKALSANPLGKLTELQKAARSNLGNIMQSDAFTQKMASLGSDAEKQKFLDDTVRRTRETTAKLFNVPVESLDSNIMLQGQNPMGTTTGAAGVSAPVTKKQLSAASLSTDPGMREALRREMQRRDRLNDEIRQLVGLEAANRDVEVAKSLTTEPLRRNASMLAGTGEVVDDKTPKSNETANPDEITPVHNETGEEAAAIAQENVNPANLQNRFARRIVGAREALPGLLESVEVENPAEIGSLEEAQMAMDGAVAAMNNPQVTPEGKEQARARAEAARKTMGVLIPLRAAAEDSVRSSAKNIALTMGFPEDMAEAVATQMALSGFPDILAQAELEAHALEHQAENVTVPMGAAGDFSEFGHESDNDLRDAQKLALQGRATTMRNQLYGDLFNQMSQRISALRAESAGQAQPAPQGGLNANALMR